jgi:hypothetical protein
MLKQDNISGESDIRFCIYAIITRMQSGIVVDAMKQDITEIIAWRYWKQSF